MCVQRKCLCNVFWTNNYEKSMPPPPLPMINYFRDFAHFGNHCDLIIIITALYYAKRKTSR